MKRVHRLLLLFYRRLPTAGRRFVVRRITPSYTVGAICVVERGDGAVLLVRLSYRNQWGFPGGLLQRGEEAVDGARREALEEVGLQVEVVGEPAVVVDVGPRRVDVVFRCRPAPGTDAEGLRPQSAEIEEVRWFPESSLPELQHEASQALVALARTAVLRGHR